MRLIIIVVIVLLLSNCSNNKTQKEQMEDFDKIYISASTELMKIKGVTGVGQGATEDGKDCIIVFVSDSTMSSKEIPKKYKKIPVKIQDIGQVNAQ
jgi:hypothetical protein